MTHALIIHQPAAVHIKSDQYFVQANTFALNWEYVVLFNVFLKNKISQYYLYSFSAKPYFFVKLLIWPNFGHTTIT